MTATLHMIAYASKYNKPSDHIENDVADIVETAKRMNPRFDITGALFYNQGVFMQVIEGKKPDLRQLMQNIHSDPRHGAIEILIDEPVSERGFSEWNMDFFDLSDGDNLDIEKLKAVAQDYKISLLPRADVFVKFYKAILQHTAG